MPNPNHLGYWIAWGAANGPYDLGPYDTIEIAQMVYLLHGGGAL